MIRDRPKFLAALPGFRELPNAPVAIDWATVPDRVQLMMMPLGGIQPITVAMCDAAGGDLEDKPSPGEVELFRKKGTHFQLISIVLNLAAVMDEGGKPTGVPYSISLIPAQKRGKVEEVTIDFIEKIDPNLAVTIGSCYRGYDPFEGDWSIYGPASVLLPAGAKGHIDEVGLVVDQFFLATEYDEADVAHTPGGFDDAEVEARYDRHRMRRLFRPFQKVGARRVWGAESPIELFFLQGLLSRGLRPQLQFFLRDDGEASPSLYHLWHDAGLAGVEGMITEADMYFPDHRVAVFCDSSRWHRGGQKQAKDRAIDARLEAAGFVPVRVQGAAIVKDLEETLRQVEAALT